jgi:hypothetical protein
MKKHLYFVFSVILLCIIYTNVSATHIRAGEITATLISCQNYSYRFTVTGYTDLESDVIFGGGEINYGDGVIDEFPTGDMTTSKTLGI